MVTSSSVAMGEQSLSQVGIHVDDLNYLRLLNPGKYGNTFSLLNWNWTFSLEL